MRVFFYIVLFITIFKTVSAQELPFNSQIFVNPYYYNPAYAGFEGRPAFYVYRRQQWTGIEGAPVTTGFNFHTIFNEKVNFGLNFMTDKRSIFNTTRALVTFGYRASFDDFHYLSFGLSGGMGFNSIDMDAIDPNDPVIANALDNSIFLDGNTGFNYFNNGFNLGLSLPKIFKTKYLSSAQFAEGEISPLNDAIFMTSYKWVVTEEKFAIEPHAIYYYSTEAPGQFEVIGLMHLMDVFLLGASYRQEYGVTGFIGLNVNDNFKFGYAYEFFNVEAANFSTGSHDIQLALVFGEKKKKKQISLMQKRRNVIRTQTKPLSQETKQTTKPVVTAPVTPTPTQTETYNESDALDDLIAEMEAEQAIQEDTVSFEEFEIPVEESTDDIFDIQFDDVQDPEPEVAKVIAPVVVPEINDEESLINQMDEETYEEITFDDEEELTKVTDNNDAIEVEEVYIEPTLDDEGLYIGPTTVTKGDHMLELNTGNYVAVGTFDNYLEAEEYSDALFIKGYYTKFGFISQTKIYYVYIYENDDLQEVIDTSERFNSIGAQFRENWVLQVK